MKIKVFLLDTEKTLGILYFQSPPHIPFIPKLMKDWYSRWGGLILISQGGNFAAAEATVPANTCVSAVHVGDEYPSEDNSEYASPAGPQSP